MKFSSVEFARLLLISISVTLSCLVWAPAEAATPSRTVLELDPGWRFSKGDFANAMMPAFNDESWPEVDLPHDWSSEGPFSADYASGNGYAPGGIGWYRKHFTVAETDTNKLIAVE